MRLKERPQLHDVETFRAEAAKSGGKVLAVRQFVSVAKDEGGDVNFVMSSEAIDRSRDIIKQTGWRLDNYNKAGRPILFGHDQSIPTIGRFASAGVEHGEGGTRLLGRRAEFAPRDSYPLAGTVGDLVRLGFMNTGSVGFLPVKFNFNAERGGVDFEEQELLEFSIVPVPANPEALQGARSAGIELVPLVEWIERHLDGEKGGATLIIPRDQLEAARKAATGSKFVTAGKADEEEPAEDEGDDELMQALAMLTEAVKENTAEIRAMRADMAEKAVADAKAKPAIDTKPKGFRAPSPEEIAERLEERLSKRISGLLGRVD